MTETPTPLDLDALAAAEAEAKHYRAQRDEWFLMESGAREAAEAEVILLRTRIRKARHQRDEARAEVARLTARPDPAWDEEAVRDELVVAVREAHRAADTCSGPWADEAMTDAVLAVVRDHLPAKPSREDIYRAWHGTDDPWGGCADSASIERVLALWPGRSEAEVRAEALREWVEDVTGDLAATKAEGIDLGRDYLHGMRSALMQATERADRLAAEGGADRG